MLAEVLARCPDPRFRDDGRRSSSPVGWTSWPGGSRPKRFACWRPPRRLTGQFPQAAATAQAALELAEQQHKGPLAESLKADVPRYKAEQPQ